MKKILLIEDRPKRQQLFIDTTNISFENYCNILDNQNEKYFYESILNDESNLNQYSYIISHKSVGDDKSVEVVEKLKKHCEDTNTPLILFSGGVSTTYYNEESYTVMELNSKTFYSKNIELFLEAFINGDENILMLCYGLKWKLNIVLNTLEKINRFIDKHSKQEDIQYDKFLLEVDRDKLKNINFNFYELEVEDGWVYLNEIKKYQDSLYGYIRENIDE